MKKQVHINLHKHRMNHKHHSKYDKQQPAIAIRTYKGVSYVENVELNGNIKFIYRPNKPLSCGAKMWIETQDEVTEKFNNNDFDEDYYNVTIAMEMHRNKVNPMYVTIDNTLINPDNFQQIEASYLEVNGKVRVMQMYDLSATWYYVATNSDAIKVIETSNEKDKTVSELWICHR